MKPTLPAWTASPAPQYSAWRVSAIGCIVFAIGCGVLGAYLRGPSLDEFATQIFADPEIPIRKAWAELWPTESNPPFFYLIARWATQLGADSFPARRLINLVPLAGLVAWMGVTALRRPESRAFLLLFGVLTLCGKIFLQDFPYYRSYFWQFAAEIVFIGAAVLDRIAGRTRPSLAQLLALPFLLNLHQVTALYALLLLATLNAADVMARNWLRAGALSLAAAVSLAPIGVFTLAQLSHATEVVGLVDWIAKRGPLAALAEIAAAIPPALGQNWIAMATFVVAWSLPTRPTGARRQTAMIIALACAAATLAMLVINAIHPIVVQRYFSFAIVETAALIALSIEPAIARRPWVGVLVVANGLVFLLTYGVGQVHKKMWERGAEIVAGIVAQCPGTRVHGGSMPLDPRETMGLRYLGQIHGFTVSPPQLDLPRDCPVLYWSEGNVPTPADLTRFGGSLARATNFTAGYKLPEDMLSIATAVKSEGGVIIAVGASPEIIKSWKLTP